MTQPAKMTLEVRTVRGIHDCQARNSQMGTKAWVASLATTLRFVCQNKVCPARPVDLCLLAVWMVTQKQPKSSLLCRPLPRRSSIDFDRFVQLGNGPANLDLERDPA